MRRPYLPWLPRLRRQRRCEACRRPLTERERGICGYCELAPPPRVRP